MKTHRTPLLAAVAAVTTLAAGCSSVGSDDQTTNTAAASSPVESGNDGVVTEAVSYEAAQKKSSFGSSQFGFFGTPHSSGESDNQTGSCAALPNDPREQYPDDTAPGRMPMVDPNFDFNYWISDIENHYDPCARVSFILFHGKTGTAERPSMREGTRDDGVAFYINGVPDGEMRMFGVIEDIRVNGDTIYLSWGEPTGINADGPLLHRSVTLSTANGHIEAVSGDVVSFNSLWDNPSSQYMLGTYD